MPLNNQKEMLEGCVLDIAFIRSYPQDELLKRAEVHTKNGALMGRCMESGYGLINTNSVAALLDPKATSKVVEVMQSSPSEKGIYLKVHREMNGEKMETVDVEEVKYYGLKFHRLNQD